MHEAHFQHRERIVVPAAPKVVYDLLSDITRMGEWSPETFHCEWTE